MMTEHQIRGFVLHLGRFTGKLVSYSLVVLIWIGLVAFFGWLPVLLVVVGFPVVYLLLWWLWEKTREEKG